MTIVITKHQIIMKHIAIIFVLALASITATAQSTNPLTTPLEKNDYLCERK